MRKTLNLNRDHIAHLPLSPLSVALLADHERRQARKRNAAILLITMALIAMASAVGGCAHHTPTISEDTRKRLHVVREGDMSEEDAMKIYGTTGVYRGLTDEEWIEVMKIIGEQTDND